LAGGNILVTVILLVESRAFLCAILHKSAVLNKFVQFKSVKCAVGKWTI